VPFQPEDRKECVEELRKDAKRGTVTFLYSAKDTERNNAVALKDLLQ
jgi:uncharacterized protein YeaO (DUF488 family)